MPEDIDSYWYTDVELSAIETVRQGSIKLANDIAAMSPDVTDQQAASDAARIAVTASDAAEFISKIKESKTEPLRAMLAKISGHVADILSSLLASRAIARKRLSEYGDALSRAREAELAKASSELKAKVEEYKKDTVDYSKWDSVNAQVEVVGAAQASADSKLLISDGDVSVSKRKDYDYEVINVAELAAHYPGCVEVSRAKLKSVIKDVIASHGDDAVIPGIKIIKRSSVTVRGK